MRNTSTSGTITTGSFAAKVDFAVADVSSRGIGIGDLDGDGLPDLAVANFGAVSVSMLRNTSTPGSLSFASNVEFTTGTNPQHLGLADIDGDGKLDLVTGNDGDGSISVLRNNGSSGTISFAAKSDFAADVNPRGLSIGDLDGDALPDIAIANSATSTISVFHNSSTSGTITLDSKVDFAVGTGPVGVAIGDIDGDRRPEVVIANNSSGNFSVLYNIADQPTITSLGITSGAPGAALAINGTNFDATHTNNTVFIGGIKATTTAGNTTQITATIPNGATFGPVTVLVNGRTAESDEFFLPRYAGVNQTIDAGLLAGKVDFTAGTTPQYVASGDIDGDGKPDLVVSDYNGTNMSVFRNTSTSGGINGATFAAKVDFAMGTTGSREILIADLDGDGKQDVIVANPTGTSVSVFRNTATSGTINGSSFAAKVDFAAGNGTWGLATGDLDGDGKIEILASNVSDNTISVLRNSSVSGVIDANSFATQVTYATNATPVGVDVGDIDGDGKVDIAVANLGADNVSIFRNLSTPGTLTTSSFATKVDYATAADPKGIEIADVDGDGKRDIVTANEVGNSISVLRSTSTSGSLAFDAKVDYATNTSPQDVTLADFDGDGKPDIAATSGGADVISVFKNNSTSGTVSLATKVDFATPDLPNGLAAADFDGDGRADVVSAIQNTSSISVYHNIADPPTISSLSVTTGSPASSVTITGTNFDATHTNNTVFFGGVKATTTAGNTTSITATVPDGATFGPVTVVTLGGRTAHSDEFFLPTYTGVPTITTGTLAAKVDFTAGTNPFEMAMGDLDGDNKPDLVVLNYGSNTISIFRNTSSSGTITTGSFSSKVDFATGDNPRGVALGDIDGDGKLDIAVVNYNTTTGNSVSVFKNTTTTGINGSSFAAKVDFTTGTGPWMVALGDIDRDGKPDIVTSNKSANSISVLRNTSVFGTIDGNSFLTKVDYAAGTQPLGLGLGDIDGDGLTDIIQSNEGAATLSVFRNTSTGGIIGSSSLATKVDFAVDTIPNQLAIGDIDSDAKPDLVVVNETPNTISVLRNTSTSGSVSFAAKVDLNTGTDPYDVTLGDVDGDGKPDIAVSNGSTTTISVLRNQSTSGTILFESKVDFTAGTTPRAVLIGDIDGDGKPDLIAGDASSANISVFHNLNGTVSAFSEIQVSAGVDDANNGESVAVGDFDNDGEVDFYLVNDSADNKLFKKNSGSNTWTNQVNLTAASGHGGPSAAFGDYDNDGDLDLFLSSDNSSPYQLWENTDGSGTWSEVSSSRGLAITSLPGYSPVWVDYDQDGDLDLSVIVYGGANHLYQNDGLASPTFSDVASSAGVDDGGQAEGQAWADYNNDGFIDFYVANNTASTNLLYKSNGDGTFTEDATSANALGLSGPTVGAAWGDFDNDGDFDLHVANNSTTTDQLLSNDGDGTFTDATTSSLTTNTGDAVSSTWADYDNDGDLDLFVHGNGSANRLWMNNNDGTFTDIASAVGVDEGSASGRAATWVDVDTDGFLDLYVVNDAAEANKLFYNNGNSNQWLLADLNGVVSPSYAQGAVVKVYENGVFEQTRMVGLGQGWNTQPDLLMHIGLGSVTSLDSIEVIWSSGAKAKQFNVTSNQVLALTEETSPEGNFAFGLDFDGANDRVEVPALDLSGGSAMTIEAWIKPTDITTNVYYDIIRQELTATSYPDFSLEFQANGTILSFGLFTGAYQELDVTVTPGKYTDGNWHHIAAVYDGTNKYLYSDGLLIGAQTFLEYGTGESLVNQQSLPDFVTKHQVTLTNLKAGTTYQYRVKATDAASNGPTASRILSFTTELTPDLVAPKISVAPVVQAVTDVSAVIKWSTDELSDSGVNFAEGSGLSANGLGLFAGASSDVLTHEVALTNLTPGTTYTYLVQSTDRSNNGPATSEVLTFTTLANKDETAPSAPQKVVARGALGQLVVSWAAPPENDVAGYDVLRAVGDAAFVPVATFVPNAKYVDDGLDATTVYRYQIQAVDASGNQSAVSEIASASPDGSGLPSAPVAVGVQGGTPTLVVENASGASGLIYNFAVATDDAFTQVVAQVSGISEGAGTDQTGRTGWTVSSTLTEGTTYYWRAWAFDGVFDGPFMPTASFVAGSALPTTNVGDFDGDLVVGFGDFLMFVSAFGSAQGQPKYNNLLDLNSDGSIGFADFLTFVNVFGNRYGAGKIAPKVIPEDGDAQSLLEGTLPNVGEVFDVTVKLVQANDVAGYGFEVWYDPAIVSFEGAMGTGPLGGVLSESGGVISFGGVVSAESGSDEIAHLSFRLLRDVDSDFGPFVGLADFVLGDFEGSIRRVIDRGDLVALPSVTALKPNYPNPFNPVTTIPYAVATEGLVSLRVYNPLGQRVATLVNDLHTPGFYRVVWDGRNALGHNVASGIYMVRMVASDYVSVSKVLLLK